MANEKHPENGAYDNTNEENGAEGAVKFAPLPPFDVTAGESFALYDSMKYVCDTDLCNRGMIKLESGNVCKGYRVKETKPVKIGGDVIDDEENTALEAAEDDACEEEYLEEDDMYAEEDGA